MCIRDRTSTWATRMRMKSSGMDFKVTGNTLKFYFSLIHTKDKLIQSNKHLIYFNDVQNRNNKSNIPK